ncbi:T9SS type A sorting domain-containing protein [Fulvivirga sp. M361]|uniref:CBM35 domain-containing protein n=1 Tax=Fulvivirga sp. M361 TaxID=2594266 RepID=UPI00117B4D14|nr:CBM35 domain-containing protein [Fulvivirga sp. M361]TRX48797.1 T9SS type A sorting domain-containing protein [Fulvivirga sp. M361]
MKKLLLLLTLSISSGVFAQDAILKEAEDGTLTGTLVETSKTGFSGTGYVTGFDADGDKVSVTLNIPTANTYELTIGYASEFGDKTNDIYVNGNFLMQQVFPESNSFTPLKIGDIALAEGENVVEIRKNWGFFDVDYFSFKKKANIFIVDKDPVKIELEEGELIGIDIDNTEPGFSGTGYLTGLDNDGDKVILTINVSAAGEFSSKIGYRSVFGDKTQSLYLNDVFSQNIVFPQSATFTDLEVGVLSLVEGINTVEIRKNYGFQELDYLTITPVIPATPPVAVVGADQVVMDTDGDGLASVVLDASMSSDVNNNISTYIWKNAAGDTLGESATLSVPLEVGGHDITLTVKDATNLEATDQLKVFIGDGTNYGNNRIGIRAGSQDVFASGLNLAWDEYSKDIVELNQSYFKSVLDDMESTGGNALRWWLHTNGRFSPVFNNAGGVTGLGPNTISNMRKVLDLAYERGVIISMCLWSFDMLQNQGQNVSIMKQLLENPQATKTYIDNALIPIIEELGDHPAVMCWEVFNEAEGMTNEFGWTPTRTSMKSIQQFVNLVAGAIHRTEPKALVSTGAWSFKALTDQAGFFNYYRDDRLIAAGGDTDGTLDFYQVHYYPEHFGNVASPFHRPASWWDLDKPIVIGEFPVREIDGQADPNYSTTEAYQLAYEYGYAGAMAWSYSGFDGGDFNDAKEGMNFLMTNHASDILIGPDPIFNNAPEVIAEIPAARVVLGTTELLKNYADLKQVFSDPEDGSNLKFTLAGNSQPAMTKPEITDGKLSIELLNRSTGRSLITVQAEDTNGASTVVSFSVNVRDPQGNLALFESVEASSVEDEDRAADLINDGDLTTRWSSVYSDNQSVIVDLGELNEIDKVKLYWETAYASEYTLDVSVNGQSWTTVYEETAGNGDLDEITFDTINARYLRMNGTRRASVYGFSLWEFEVYGPGVIAAFENSGYRNVKVYPNPANSFLNLVVGETFDVKLMDVRGTVLKKHQIRDFHTMNISDLKPGVYFITFNNSRTTLTKKIVKN